MKPTSLTVPLVQEIAKEGLAIVPERYVLPHNERPIISTTTPLPQIPVIDLSKLLSQNLKGSELEKLHYACKEWGFFQLINHGVSTSLVENVKTGAQKLFNLPIEEKKKFQQREGDIEGYGQLFVVSEDQKLQWGDALYMFTLPPEKRKPYLFSNFPLSFRNDFEAYSGEVNKLAIQILCLMANALAMDTRDMTEAFAPGSQAMRLNYYPPCPQPELVMGLNPHSDGGGLTILLQVNDVEGLQINKDGQWIPVKPLPNAFIINIGDVLEIITNGIYRSIEHRATVNSEKERLSIAAFSIPRMESMIGPALNDLETYSEELRNLALQVIDLMADALSVDTMEMRELFGEGTQTMRLNYYPPCPQPELVMGLNPHSDAGGLAILLQANEVEGLQIRKDEQWIPVKPLPNAFIINIGDMLEIITNGIYQSIEHRVTINSNKERLSIATFYNPGMDAILRPAPSLITPQTPALFKSISTPEYYKGYLTKELRGKSFLDTMKIPNENVQKNSYNKMLRGAREWLRPVIAMESISLPVPSVQEIAKKGLKSVPERYVRPHHERPTLSSTITPLPQVPVVDVSRLLSQDHKESELNKLHSACKEWGFFQLINHGVSNSLLESVKKGVEKFFKLPIEEKKKFGQRQGELEGYGQAFVVSEEQKLEWADLFIILTLPSHLRKQHLFPNIPLPFRDDLVTYSAELKNLAILVIDLMANALEVDPKEIREILGEGLQSMRMNYYPPCPQPELVMGLNPHSDGGALTILLQANEVEGLQIKKDGLWIPVKPLPNAFIVNIGDSMEMITNGIYRSIEHRATVNSDKERLSIATFYSPSLESILGPVPSLVTPNTPAVFKRISVKEYSEGYLSRELRGKSYLDSMRIQNENDKNS
ncbi:uncharacterized protein LOC113855864 [Abrus precatorius]|uniref:Uncharacterized protein LOC113855864 n=1 Tax=Abrus precatorius TaxID=3816 RepID=A0A8B8KHK5_ABRPR|nr:uncharacterized protein LOC113855864 [Abrus precatorius]